MIRPNGTNLLVHKVPKNAHTTLTIALREREHTVFEAKNDVEGRRLMVVRHPCDRAVSAWAYFCHGQNGKLQDFMTDLGFKPRMRWDAFFEVFKNAYPHNAHLCQQDLFRCGHEIDLLVPIEKLNDTWKELRKEYPELPVLTCANASEHKHWEEYVDNAQLYWFHQVFAKDLELWRKANG